MMAVLGPFLRWYLLISLMGILTFPLAYRWLGSLADKGWAFSRTLGLLLWAFVFWLLSSLGVLMNDLGGNVLAMVLVGLLAFWAVRQSGWEEIRIWLRKNQGTIFGMELLFVVVFLLLVFFRALYPNLTATEKPMEMAFLNAILRSPTMPPHDPWLADYAISYYYLGYVMTALLTRLTAVSAGVGFNLMIALIFSLGALGAYGLAYNILTASETARNLRNRLGALLAPLFMLFLGNLEGFLEFLYLRKVGWGPNQTYTDAEGVLHSRFWDFLNIKDLINAPNLESADLALRFWWWWRGSRVIHDFNFAGNEVEVIDEFPFFSLLLADLHPHVLVIPFALLGTALALAVFLGAGQPDAEGSWLKRPMLFFDLDRGTFLVGALIYGGLAFLNIWDFPLYVGLFAGAYLLRKGAREGWRWNYIGEFFSLGVTFGIVGVLLYLPYYIGFSSQAGGILPNVINPSRGVQLWVMFGILWLPIFGYLIWTWARRGLGRNLGIGILTAFLVAAALWVVSLGLVWVIVGLSPSLAGLSPSLAQAGLDWLHSTGAPSLNEFLALGTSRRLGALPGTLTLVVLVGLTLGLLWPRGEKPESKPEPARQFLALLALFATLLVLVPEFVYLRDNFGTRMNTVFKFYYQAWLLWAVAAAVGAAMVISSAKAIGRWVFIVVLAIAVGLGSFYPAMAVNEKVSQFTDRPEPQLSLDGNAHFSYLSPDEHALVDFLRNEPLGPLVEAVGGSYTGYARIATFSGQPNLLGWPGHEGQWRGGGEEMGSRAGDIQRIYESSNWDETQALLAQYQVSYVVIAPLEMNTYAVNQAKFERNLAKIFEQGGVALYLVPSFQSSGLPTP